MFQGGRLSAAQGAAQAVIDQVRAGDVCEFSEQVPGLWPTAVEQAKVAAINATYASLAPVTLFKVAGIDLTSVGRVAAAPDDEFEIVLE